MGAAERASTRYVNSLLRKRRVFVEHMLEYVNTNYTKLLAICMYIKEWAWRVQLRLVLDLAQ